MYTCHYSEGSRASVKHFKLASDRIVGWRSSPSSAPAAVYGAGLGGMRPEAEQSWGLSSACCRGIQRSNRFSPSQTGESILYLGPSWIWESRVWTRGGAESLGEPQCSEMPVSNFRAPGYHGDHGFCPALSEKHFAGSKKWKLGPCLNPVWCPLIMSVTLTAPCPWCAVWPLPGADSGCLWVGVTLPWHPSCSAWDRTHDRNTNNHGGCSARIA